MKNGRLTERLLNNLIDDVIIIKDTYLTHCYCLSFGVAGEKSLAISLPKICA
jgi:hypothetical protein